MPRRLILSGFRRALEPRDLPALEPSLTAAGVYPEFERVWQPALDSWRASQPPRAPPPPTCTPSAARAAGAAVRALETVENSALLLPAVGIEPGLGLVARADAVANGERSGAARARSSQVQAAASNKSARSESERRAQAGGPSLLLVLLRLFWPTLLRNYALRFLHGVVDFTKPFLLECAHLL